MDILLEKTSKVIEVMANNQMAKERFDVGKGYSEFDYRRVLYLKRLLVSNDPEIMESAELIKSKLNHIKNQYL